MARFTSNHARPKKSEASPKASPKARTWSTLSELKDAAIRHGCTPAQLQHAMELVGDDPTRISNYLKRKSFVPTTFGTPASKTDD